MKRFVCSADLCQLIQAPNAQEAAKEFSKRWKIPSGQVSVDTQKEFEKLLDVQPASVRLSWRRYVRRWKKYMAKKRAAKKTAGSTQKSSSEGRADEQTNTSR